MEYLTSQQVLFIHSVIIDEIGGSHGVRELHIIENLEQAHKQVVFGKEIYPTLFFKAAFYARTIIMNHPFVDGNKRTGMTTASILIEKNNYEFVAKPGELAEYAVKIVVEHLEINEIADWFEKHSQKKIKTAG